MNSKTEKVFKKILNDSALSQEFSQLKTMDEIYPFLLKIDGDISQEDFKEFTVRLIQKCDRESIIKLTEEELLSVSGGGGGFDFLSELLARIAVKITADAIGYTISQLPGYKKYKQWKKENFAKGIAVDMGIAGAMLLTAVLVANKF